MIDEELEIIDGLLRGETFSYQGMVYCMDQIPFHIKPVQQLRIPLWIGGVSPVGLA